MCQNVTHEKKKRVLTVIIITIIKGIRRSLSLSIGSLHAKAVSARFVRMMASLFFGRGFLPPPLVKAKKKENHHTHVRPQGPKEESNNNK